MARSFVLACLIAACIALLPVLWAAPKASARASGGTMAHHINEARRAHGLPPLLRSRSLAGSARVFSRHLVATRRFAHAARIHTHSRFRERGEILANLGGHKWDRARTVRMWLNSPPHRAVILSRGFRYLGAGRSAGRLGYGPATIWVVHFGSL